jgi:CBS domain-containing protein
MAWIPVELKHVHEQVVQGQTPRVTVRKLLEWFSSERRGTRVVSSIQAALRELSLGTRPNFEDAWIDGEIVFFLQGTEGARPATVPPPVGELPAGASMGAGALPSEGAPGDEALMASLAVTQVAQQQAPNVRHDPVFRLGKLAAANKEPTVIAPDAPLSRAITVMMLNDFSQLPVTTHAKLYRIEGAVHWRSIAQAYALQKAPVRVQECMGFAPVYSADDSVFEALDEMTQYGFVLVRAQNRLQGIVTLVDVASEFRGSFEPFVLIGEIERHLRQLLDRHVPLELIRRVCEVPDSRPISGASDLSFGQYQRLLEREDVWNLCGLLVDRGEISRRLEKIREIRNEMMHFHSEAVDREGLETIRSLAVFLREVLH